MAQSASRLCAFLLGLCLVPFLAACVHSAPLAAPSADQRLERLAAGDGDPAHALAGVALVVMQGDTVIYAGAAGRAHIETGADRPMTPETKVRVASISKMALALVTQEQADAGTINLDHDVSDYLGWPLRNPAAPNAVITMRHLLAHTSTLRDPEEYWAPLGDDIRSLILVEDAPFSATHPVPGDWYEYTNLNFGVAATALEAATGTRFDQLASRYFAAHDLDIGYNWSGVSRAARAEGGTLYRREDGTWIAQTDDTPALNASAPVFINTNNLDLAAYTPGTNGTLFSPQGGVRASAGDLARLVRELKQPHNRSLWSDPWRYDAAQPNGVTSEGGPKAYDFTTAYGLAVHLLEGDHPGAAWPGETLIGHAGEAYGLLSGAWVSTARDLSFAYVITGISDASEPPRGQRTKAFSVYEEALIDLARDIAPAR
ncbi:MAG: serine hydrolase domain-containing protein [Hyphomonas sp.]|uniref:serine hydrolase domain-containing protein n=1 Tax=Hyphomonas sp. TaxID=87 RepID=UPI003002FEBB